MGSRTSVFWKLFILSQEPMSKEEQFTLLSKGLKDEFVQFLVCGILWLLRTHLRGVHRTRGWICQSTGHPSPVPAGVSPSIAHGMGWHCHHAPPAPESPQGSVLLLDLKMPGETQALASVSGVPGLAQPPTTHPPSPPLAPSPSLAGSGTRPALPLHAVSLFQLSSIPLHVVCKLHAMPCLLRGSVTGHLQLVTIFLLLLVLQEK